MIIFFFFSIKVPEEFDFVETFDLFFKVHKVFNQVFEPDLAVMMGFIQNIIYKMNEIGVNPTNRMKEVETLLSQTKLD